MRRPASLLNGAVWLLGLLLLSLRLCQAAGSIPVALTGRVEVGWTGGCEGCGAPCVQRLAFRDDLGRLYDLALPDNLHARLGDPFAAAHRRWRIRGSLTPVRAGRRGRPSIAVSELAAAPSGDLHAQNFGLPPALGHKPFVTVLCRFADTAGVTPQPPAYFARAMDTTYPRMGHYFGELSYGQMDLAGSQVAGWYTLPRPMAAYLPPGGTVYDWDHDALIRDVIAVADADVDFHSFYGVNIAINVPVPCCWCWISSGPADGRPGLWPFTMTAATAQGTYYQASWAHEMGHGLGMPHSSGPYAETYDSKWDVMSQGFGTAALTDPSYPVPAVGTIAYQKEIVGWIPASRKYLAQVGTRASVQLERLTQPAGTGYLMAKVPVAGSESRYYTVEARAWAGYDRNVPREGVVIHLVDTARPDRQAQVVDADGDGDPNDEGATWLPGETFEDTANHVRVAVLSATASGYVVDVANGGALVPPSGLVATAASPTSVNLRWNDNSAEETGFDVERRAAGAAGWTVLRAGANATSYADAGLAPQTLYTYRVRATNAGGASGYTAEASASTQPVFAIRSRVAYGATGVAGATVAAGSASASTASDGSYVLDGLGAGNYAVSVRLVGYRFEPASRQVTLGPDRAGVDFAATPVFRLSGRVTLGTAGAGGVLVSVGSLTATTAADGSYAIADVPAGTQTVAPSDPRYTFSPPSRSLEVTGDAGGLDFAAALRTFSVRGAVTEGGAPLPGVAVSAGPAQAATGPDGSYVLPGLAAGTYAVTARKDGYLFSPASRSVTVGPDQAGADFAAERTYAVSGRVAEGQAGRGGATVTVGARQAVTAADGTFAVSGLRKGQYQVSAALSGYVLSPASIPVSLGPDAQGLAFEAQRAYRVSGQVTENGAGLAGVSVTAGGMRAVTAGDGRYALDGLVAGTYPVSATRVGYAFSPTSRDVALGPDQPGVDFAASRVPVVSGLILKFGAVRGGTKCPGTVTLDRPATTALTVALASDSPAVVAPDRGVKIAKGKTTGKFTLKTLRVQQDVTVTVTASCNGGSRSDRLGVSPR